MIADFTNTPELQEFLSIPPGTYTCRIAEVREGVTRDGSPRWALRLVVAEGDYAGRTGAWDGLVWSERGLPRVKYVLEQLGFQVSGRVELAPKDLVDRTLETRLVPEEREDPLTGRRVLRLRVPYRGYGAEE